MEPTVEENGDGKKLEVERGRGDTSTGKSTIFRPSNARGQPDTSIIAVERGEAYGSVRGRGRRREVFSERGKEKRIEEGEEFLTSK